MVYVQILAKLAYFDIPIRDNIHQYQCDNPIISISAMGDKTSVLHVEPGIFEWLGWYQLGLPKWFTPAELKSHGYNIDVNYKPYVNANKLDYEETIEGYYKRSGETARHILRMHEKEGKFIHCMLIGQVKQK